MFKVIVKVGARYCKMYNFVFSPREIEEALDFLMVAKERLVCDPDDEPLAYITVEKEDDNSNAVKEDTSTEVSDN